MTIWYVRPVNGSDANDGTSYATAWATTQQAINSITADTGDEYVHLVSEGVEETTTGVKMLRDVVYRSTPLHMKAVGPNGETGDLLDYAYTIRATGGAVTEVLGMSGGSDGNNYRDNYEWYGVIFDANSAANYAYYNVLNAGTNAYFYGCRFANAILDGVRQSGYNITLYRSCEFDNNGGYGFTINGSNRGNSVHKNCSYHDNVSGGAFGGNSVSFNNCLFYDNTGYGVNGNARYVTSMHIENSLIYNNGDDGIQMEGSVGYNSGNHIRNNIIYGNGGWGFQSDLDDWTNAEIYNNFIDNNTAGAFDLDNPLKDWHRNITNVAIDFDVTTGQLNYNSPIVNSAHPFGGAPGGAAREDVTFTDVGQFSLGTGGVGDTVTVSGKSFQLVQDNPRAWRRV